MDGIVDKADDLDTELQRLKRKMEAEKKILIMKNSLTKKKR